MVSVYRIIATPKSQPCGLQWIGKCDFYCSGSKWGVDFAEDFHQLGTNNGYGIVIHGDKAAVKASLRAYDWEKFGRTINNTFRINKHTLQTAAAG